LNLALGLTFAPDPILFTSRRFYSFSYPRIPVEIPTILKTLNRLCMKKIYAYLHQPNVQAYLIIGFIFLIVAVATILTSGK